jgi:hypothetical protein
MEEVRVILVRCKEFLNASRWYFMGPPPAEGGRRPRAEAAASPQGWPPLKPLSPFRRFLIANGISSMAVPYLKLWVGYEYISKEMVLRGARDEREEFPPEC